MPWVIRHILAVATVAVALAVVGAVFVFARPAYHPPYRSYMVNMDSQTAYSVAAVERAFATEGIRLYVRSTIAETTYLADAMNIHEDDGLLVTRFRPHGTVNFNASKLATGWYEKRLGNVVVDFTGHNLSLGQRAAAALAALKR